MQSEFMALAKAIVLMKLKLERICTSALKVLYYTHFLTLKRGAREEVKDGLF